MKIGIMFDVHLQEQNPRCRTDDYIQTALGKIEYVLENNDKVIFLGDLFNKYSGSTYLFNKVYNLFSKHPNKVIAIWGNHDLYHRSYTDYVRTTLGGLHFTEALEIKTEAFEIDGTTFAVSKVDKDISKIPVDEHNTNILLGHNYYEMNLCPEESLTRDDLIKLNYRAVILGHDHSPYEEMFIGNSILIRDGSTTRIDTQNYNKDRKIYYRQYDTVTRDITKVEIPHKLSKDVYIENAFTKVVKNTISYVNLVEAIEKLKKQSEGTVSLDKALKKLKTPKKHIDTIKAIYDLNQLVYN